MSNDRVTDRVEQHQCCGDGGLKLWSLHQSPIAGNRQSGSCTITNIQFCGGWVIVDIFAAELCFGLTMLFSHSAQTDVGVLPAKIYKEKNNKNK